MLSTSKNAAAVRSDGDGIAGSAGVGGGAVAVVDGDDRRQLDGEAGAAVELAEFDHHDGEAVQEVGGLLQDREISRETAELEVDAAEAPHAAGGEAEAARVARVGEGDDGDLVGDVAEAGLQAPRGEHGGADGLEGVGVVDQGVTLRGDEPVGPAD